MAKQRVTIPAKTRDDVLKEFNHRCAICGADKPQVHHIDEDPSNNEQMNLIPLCPNCHLIDQHNPTTPIEPAKLRLFRQHKDPSILKPQFHPLWIRLSYLDWNHDEKIKEKGLRKYAPKLEKRSKELVSLVKALEMGGFYSEQIQNLVKKPSYITVISMEDLYINRYTEEQQNQDRKYVNQLQKNRNRIFELAIELLRYQKWD